MNERREILFCIKVKNFSLLTLNHPLEAATARLKKDEERLIVDLFYVEGKKAREIANLLRMKEKAVYKISEKFRKFFKDELKIRGNF